MCGRYALYNTRELPKRFGTRPPPKSFRLRDSYNVAPGQMLPVVAQTGRGKTIEIMKWGLVPTWAKDPNIGYRMINARAEGVFDKPAWRGPARHHRCLVPASGFYEWQERPGERSKQPFYIFPKGEEQFAFAGLYDTWSNDEGDELWTYAIITTGANKQMTPIHDRMPVILDEHDWDAWIDPQIQERDPLEELLRPYPSGELEMYPVSADVNAVQHNDRHLVQPVHGA